MANVFLRSGDGSDADNGTTWALAKASIDSTDGAAFAAAAGDTIYVSDNHAETQASALTHNFAGTFASPVNVICVDDTGDPATPTAVATTATISTTGTNSIAFTGCAYLYGITWSAGTTGGSITAASGANNYMAFEECTFKIDHTNTNGRINLGASNNAYDTVTLINCHVKFGNTGGRIIAGGSFKWRGGSVLSGSSAPSVAGLISMASTGRAASALIEGVDLVNIGSSTPLIGDTLSASEYRCIFRNCKLPASWSGTLFVSGVPTGPGVRGELWNCSAGDTNYAMWVEDYAGSIKHETTLVRTSGASDGDTAFSRKMTTSANAEYPTFILRSPEIYVPNTAVGSSQTATIHIIHDGTAALNNDEVWLEAQYLGTSGVPLSLFADDAKADVLASAAAQAADTAASWDSLVTARGNLTAYSVGDLIKVASNSGRVFICTSAGTTGVSEAAGFATAADGDSVTDTTAVFRAMWRRKLEVTFTPQEEGVHILTVCAAIASRTIYYCSKADVS